MALTFAHLRAHARDATLFPPTTLAGAVERLGFVQADPIRAPARAQDLILRHRVRGYRAGDLERAFPRLGLEEDFLHAHGFMPAATRHLLHPRHAPAAPEDAAPEPAAPEPAAAEPEGLAAQVLAFVRHRGPTHPRDLEARFGRDRAANNWGGFSKATTRALESLHRQGLLRIARRRDGIRIYGPAPPQTADIPPADRARALVRLVTRILAPVSLPSLRGALALLAGHSPGLGKLAPVVVALLKAGELERDDLEGETYLWPAGQGPSGQPSPREVRLLAPFDPLVWDRRRFQHLWGWDYRFEAYTPPSRRRFGYYAMPLLYADTVIGWANVSLAAGVVTLTPGYAVPPPRSKAYQRALDAEQARLQRALSPRETAG